MGVIALSDRSFVISVLTATYLGFGLFWLILAQFPRVLRRVLTRLGFNGGRRAEE